MEVVESALKQMGENVLAVQGTAVPSLAQWGQPQLEECQARWEMLSKQVRKNKKVWSSIHIDMDTSNNY